MFTQAVDAQQLLVDVERALAVAVKLGGADLEHLLGRTLDENPQFSVRVAVAGRHIAALGLERNGIDTRPLRFARFAGEAGLGAQHQQGALGRVSDDAHLG